jgi:hypothetical protein
MSRPAAAVAYAARVSRVPRLVAAALVIAGVVLIVAGESSIAAGLLILGIVYAAWSVALEHGERR